MGNKDSDYDQVLNLAVWHDALFHRSVVLNGLLIEVENLRLQRANIIIYCVQGQDWLKEQLAFKRLARQALADELANCRKRLYGDSINPEKSLDAKYS